MIVGLAVAAFQDFSRENNASTIGSYVAEARRQGVDMLLFGEAVLQGVDGLSWEPAEDLECHALRQGSEFLQGLRRLARAHRMAVGFGYYEQCRDTIFDSYIVFSRAGRTLVNYRRVSESWRPKRHRASEHYSEGASFGTFSFGGIRFGVILCGDLWWDELTPRIRGLDCDYLLWPLYIDYSVTGWETSAKQEYLERIRSVGKDTFIINSIQTKAGGANGGAYHIRGTGEPVAELPMGEEGILKLHVGPATGTTAGRRGAK